MSVSPQLNARDQTERHVAALGASAWKTRWQAAQTLGELRAPRAVEPLMQALADSNQWVRIVATEALGQIGDPVAVQAMISGLDDPSMWVRRASVVALGQIGSPRAITPLVERLLSPPNSQWPEELRDAIARALSALGGPAIQVLIDALESSDPWVSSAAARALGQIGDPQAIAPLAGLMQQKHSWARSAATQALAQIADARAVRAALTTDEAPRAFWKLMALKKIDQSTIDQLTAMLHDPDEHIRTQASAVLSRIGGEGDAEAPFADLRPRFHPQPVAKSPPAKPSDRTAPLIAALKDPAGEVRAAAAEALGKIGDGGAISALSQALLDQDSRVRAAAARALGEIGR